jgi:hypothetical protein
VNPQSGKIKKNLPAPTAAAAQIFAQAIDGLSDIRFGENIGYDRPRATFRMTVRTIALVGFVPLTAVATVLGNIPLVRRRAVTKPPSGSDGQ